MEGAGRGAGEPPEQAWSRLGPYGYVTHNASLPARQAQLERVSASWNASKMQTLPKLLGDMHGRAHRQQLDAEDDLRQLQEYARRFNITDAEVSRLIPSEKIADCYMPT